MLLLSACKFNERTICLVHSCPPTLKQCLSHIMFSIYIYWFNEEIWFLLQYLRYIVFYSQIPLRIWKKSNKSFLPRYTCIIMHTVSLGLNHSCLWTKKFCSKNNIKTKLQNWEIEMINCIHYFCSPCFRCYHLRSWPDGKMKTNGEKIS